MAKSNLAKLAKGGSSKKDTTTKKTVVEVPEKVLTPEEERDLKAKQKAEELMGSIDIIPKKKDDDLLEVDDELPKEGSEWLGEQVSLLSEQVESLRAELALAKGDYQKIFEENQRIKAGVGIQDDGAVKANVIKIFNELQENHFAMGVNFIIYPVAFMNRLVVFFPFLEKVKRY
jgi:hypothetical protein